MWRVPHAPCSPSSGPTIARHMPQHASFCKRDRIDRVARQASASEEERRTCSHDSNWCRRRALGRAVSRTTRLAQRRAAGPRDHLRVRPAASLTGGADGGAAPRLDGDGSAELDGDLGRAQRALPGGRARPSWTRTRDSWRGRVHASRIAPTMRWPSWTCSACATAIFVGYSMGGPIAQLIWRRHASRVSGLVLCATAADFTTPAIHLPLVGGARTAAANHRRSCPPWVRRRVARPLVTGLVTDPVMRNELLDGDEQPRRPHDPRGGAGDPPVPLDRVDRRHRRARRRRRHRHATGSSGRTRQRQLATSIPDARA